MLDLWEMKLPRLELVKLKNKLFLEYFNNNKGGWAKGGQITQHREAECVAL